MENPTSSVRMNVPTSLKELAMKIAKRRGITLTTLVINGLEQQVKQSEEMLNEIEQKRGELVSKAS